MQTANRRQFTTPRIDGLASRSGKIVDPDILGSATKWILVQSIFRLEPAMRILTCRRACESGLFAVAALLGGCTDYYDLTAPSHDCATHANVEIKASSGSFAIVGPCGTIFVSGSGNKVVVAQAKAIDVRGNDNTVAVEATDDITIKNSSRNTVTFAKGLTGSGPNCLRQGTVDSVCERRP